jgi:uncharacterized membrane protein YkgB
VVEETNFFFQKKAKKRRRAKKKKREEKRREEKGSEEGNSWARGTTFTSSSATAATVVMQLSLSVAKLLQAKVGTSSGSLWMGNKNTTLSFLSLFSLSLSLSLSCTAVVLQICVLCEHNLRDFLCLLAHHTFPRAPRTELSLGQGPNP